MKETVDAVRRLARNRGFDIVRFPLATSLYGHLARILRQNKVSLVLDVGANLGQFAQGLRKQVGYKGRIVSFEPYERARAQALHTFRHDANWMCESFAISSKSGKAALHTFTNSDWNSLHPPSRPHLSIAGRTLLSTGLAECETRRLDEVWPWYVQEKDVVFLKSDTQGHDLEVLSGAGDRLGEVAGLLLEVSILPFYAGEPSMVDVLQRCEELGFTPSGFFPVARQKNSLALTTLDVCFVARRITHVGDATQIVKDVSGE